MVESILILGIGNAQKDLFEYCSRHHIRTYACSYTDQGPAATLADHFEPVDIADVNGVLDYARWADVDLVYSIGSDIAMTTIGSVSEALGLPHFVSARVARICNNKAELRSFLGAEFAGNLKHQVIRDTDESIDLTFPLMMKPVDSQGQRGVRKVTNMEELLAHFPNVRSYSRSGDVILEAYVDGPEISVNTYSVDGRMVFLLCSERIVWPQYQGGIIHKHRIPCESISPEALANVERLVEQTLEKLKIVNGPAYFQIKLSRDTPILLEVTPRLDGCHLWRVISEYSGFDLLDAAMKHLSGTPPQEHHQQPQASGQLYELEFFCDVPGEPFSSNKYSPTNPIFLEWFYADNETIRPVNGLFEKCGYQIIRRDQS